jgi:hypothetical protein
MPKLQPEHHVPNPPQPFTDESRSADEERNPAENDRIRTDEATEQDKKAAQVDEAHRLAR